MADASPPTRGRTPADTVRRLRLRLEAEGRAGLAAVPRPVGRPAARDDGPETREYPAASGSAHRATPDKAAAGSEIAGRQREDSEVASREDRAAEAARTLKEEFAEATAGGVEATADEDGRPLPRPARSTAGAEDAPPAPAVHVKGPGLFDAQSPDLEDGSSPEEALRRIADEVATCPRCPELVENRTNTVPGQGDPRADLMFIGEAPGADEDREGLAFVGRAGQLLTKMIEGIGMTREAVFIGNVIKCRPPGNRNPAPEEEANCFPYLARQIEVIRPKVIVALGGVAAKYLLQTSDGITRLRGRFYPFKGAQLMPTFHPAYVLRNYTKDTRRKVYDDLLAAREAISQG
ncbi:MAG: uracil-DNA glycosylase family protein [Phycisphaerae bacterium]